MKQIKSIISLIIIAFVSNTAYSIQDIKIIPQPNNIEFVAGYHTVKSGVNIIANDDLQDEAVFLANILNKGFGKIQEYKKQEM